MVWVFPGVLDVRARDFRFISALISDDLPTLDLPQKANSGWVFAGSRLVIPQTVSRTASRIIISFPPQLSSGLSSCGLQAFSPEQMLFR